MSSLENVSKEAIQCLVFTDSYTRKFGRCLHYFLVCIHPLLWNLSLALYEWIPAQTFVVIQIEWCFLT